MTELYRERGRIEPQHTKQVFPRSFSVPAGARAIRFRFDYGPRKCQDAKVIDQLVRCAILRHVASRPQEERAEAAASLEARLLERTVLAGLSNLLNVVLIDPDGRWRGRWDRNPASDGGWLHLGPDQASKGFLPGPIPSGEWIAAIEVHGVFGAAVDWNLEIESTDAIAADDAPAFTGVKTATPRHKERWGALGRDFYLGEMHSHTVHSDGAHELADLASRARMLGLDFLSLTDHNATSGFREIVDLPITIVPGVELTTFAGHHPFYGVKETVPWHESGRVLRFEEIAARAHEQGALVSVAHPFKIGDPICTGCRAENAWDPSAVDMMEVWYREWDGGEHDNVAAYEVWNRAWHAGHHIIGVAARDWHGPAQAGPFPGDEPFTAVRATSAEPDAIVAGMRAGAVIMTGGPLLDLVLAGTNTRAGIGGTLEKGTARAEMAIAGLDAPAELRLLRCGEIVFASQLAKDDLVKPSLDLKPGWYRAELWQGPKPRAITNHVLIAE